VAAVLAFGDARAAAAAPKPRALASVAPFAVGRAPADEELGYFASEVARAVTSGLESAGVDVGATGEWPVSGKMEALDGGERVRLTALARGRSVAVEGPVENVDQLAAQLAQKLVPILVEGEKGRVGVRVPPPLVARADSKIENRPETRPEIKPDTKSEPKAVPSPAAVASARPPAPVAAAAPPPAPVVAQPSPEPKPAPKIEVKSEPPKEMPEVMQAYPQQPGTTYHPWGGFVSGRVVAHSIPDPPSSYVGTGISATQALYGFLGRRLRLAVVPTGVGITSPQVAVDEGWRAAARSVVMARVDNIEYLPAPEGVSVRLRVQVVVVKEGRLVLRRVVDSPASDPSRRTDPVYQAVTGALESLVSDLANAIGGS
jgi:hypothetical protein